MIRAFAPQTGRLTAVEPMAGIAAGAVWFDVVDPTPEDLAFLQAQLGVLPPTRADMEEIEASSRIYTEGGAVFMTAVLPAGADRDDPRMAPVTFALVSDRLVTLRYHGPRPFDTYPLRSDNGPIGCASGEAVLLGLLDEIVDRLADVLERAGRDIDAMSAAIFRRRRQPGTPAARGARPATPSQDFRALLDEIGSKGDLLSNLRYSLLSIERLVGFLVQAAVQRKADKVVRAQIESLRHDSNSLLDHAGFLSTKVTFLLDATLGMIGIEQNAIIKIFSVAAVAFLPPTLIASIYGMNFAAMPELAAPWGYPVALAAMVVSAVVPLWFFRRRGWL